MCTCATVCVCVCVCFPLRHPIWRFTILDGQLRACLHPPHSHTVLSPSHAPAYYVSCVCMCENMWRPCMYTCQVHLCVCVSCVCCVRVCAYQRQLLSMSFVFPLIRGFSHVSSSEQFIEQSFRANVFMSFRANVDRAK